MMSTLHYREQESLVVHTSSNSVPKGLKEKHYTELFLALLN